MMVLEEKPMDNQELSQKTHIQMFITTVEQISVSGL